MPPHNTRKPALERACTQCGATFWPFHDRSHFCSRTCLYQSYTTRVEQPCAMCGTVFLTTPSQQQRARGRYCSQACFRHSRRGTKVRPAAERFWEKVNKDGPIQPHVPHLGSCWLWAGARLPDGYGHIWFQGKTRRAHVVAYILTTGHEPPAETPLITHLCDGGSIGCVRPTHLKPDTQAGNVAGMIERGRIAQGERHGSRTHPERIPRGEDHWTRRRS